MERAPPSTRKRLRCGCSRGAFRCSQSEISYSTWLHVVKRWRSRWWGASRLLISDRKIFRPISTRAGGLASSSRSRSAGHAAPVDTHKPTAPPRPCCRPCDQPLVTHHNHPIRLALKKREPRLSARPSSGRNPQEPSKYRDQRTDCVCKAAPKGGPNAMRPSQIHPGRLGLATWRTLG
jgi:hypothetical protein